MISIAFRPAPLEGAVAGRNRRAAQDDPEALRLEGIAHHLGQPLHDRASPLSCVAIDRGVLSPDRSATTLRRRLP